MAYAYAVEGLDWEQREEFDRVLRGSGGDEAGAESKAKVREQRAAQRELMLAMTRAAGG